MNKKLLCLIPLLGFVVFAYAQKVSYNKEVYNGIKKLGTINLSELPQDYNSNLQYLEAPKVSGESYSDFLEVVKQEVREKHPVNDSKVVNPRGAADPPRVIYDFFGNIAAVGTPLDTHMAVSDGGQIISTINSHIAVMNKEGETLSSAGFKSFSLELDLANNLFDPRVFYDANEDKFVLLFLGGSSSDQTDIVVAFSETNDATGDWNLYQLPGNPFMNTTWTDFPMITVTPTDVIITINLILDDVSWQLGFVETLIWQLDKSTGYAGEELSSVMWSDVLLDGKSIRNLCPVKSGDGNPSNNTYFLSNKNFSVESDSLFLVELTGGVNDIDNEIKVSLLRTDVPYGAPPNARQPAGGTLQTNDARVLDAFIYNNDIHFVGNTRNLTTNGAGIYHGVLSDVTGVRDVRLQHIIGEDFEIGYPGISLAGSPSMEEGAMISFDHASSSRFPGISAMFYSFTNDYSDIIEVVPGDNYIDMIGNVERWGDYAGNQRKYNDPELVWITGTIGLGNFNRNIPWVAALATPDGILSNEEPILDLDQKVYPNPLQNVFYIEFDIPEGANQIKIDLLDINGRFVDQLHSEQAKQSGASRLGFNAHHIPDGTYVVDVKVDGKPLLNQKIIVQH